MPIMSLRTALFRAAILPALVVCAVWVSSATPITVNGQTCTNSGGTTCSGLLDPGTNPDIQYNFAIPRRFIVKTTKKDEPIWFFDNIRVAVDLWDADTKNTPQGETEGGEIEFVVPGYSSIHLYDIGELDGTKNNNRLSLSFLISPADQETILDEMRANGNGDFGVRITASTGSGDFHVANQGAQVNAELVPEPAAFGLIGSGLLALGLLRKTVSTSR
jgi:hypothetical protein